MIQNCPSFILNECTEDGNDPLELAIEATIQQGDPAFQIQDSI
jgi:hypothetical protein